MHPFLADYQNTAPPTNVTTIHSKQVFDLGLGRFSLKLGHVQASKIQFRFDFKLGH